MHWSTDLVGLLAAFGIAIITTPVGVSGAVFLLPVQLSVLHVPNPAVTPTNLLYNVVSGPGALVRYARRAPSWSPLARQLVLGCLPGVILGAAIRVFLVADPGAFRLCAAAVLLPLGIWLITSRRNERPTTARLSSRTITALAGGVGVVGGIYGIGGGSLLGPVLVGTGMAVSTVAPATLLTTFLTSAAGAATFAVFSLVTPGAVAPDWSLGIACGLGGLLGGYLGAALQPRLPEVGLRRLLGLLAAGLAIFYVVQSIA